MDGEILVKKAQKGDGEAFIQLIKQYKLILYRTAKRLGLKDEDIADLLQETIFGSGLSLLSLPLFKAKDLKTFF